MSFAMEAQMNKELKTYLLQDFASILFVNDSLTKKSISVDMLFYEQNYTNLGSKQYKEQLVVSSNKIEISNNYVGLNIEINNDTIRLKKYIFARMSNDNMQTKQGVKSIIQDVVLVENIEGKLYTGYDAVSKCTLKLKILELSDDVKVLEVAKNSIYSSRYYIINESGYVKAMFKENDKSFDLLFSMKDGSCKVRFFGNKIEMHINNIESTDVKKEYFLKHVNNNSFDVGDGVILIE